jgi:hypothetical protein
VVKLKFLKSRSDTRANKGSVLLPILAAFGFVALIFGGVVSWITLGQRTAAQQSFITEAENLSDLAEELIISPKSCNANFQGISLVTGTAGANGAAPTGGTPITHLNNLNGTEALSTTGGPYGAVKVDKMTLFVTGGEPYVPNPADPTSIFYKVGFYFGAKNTSDTFHYGRTLYFFVIQNPATPGKISTCNFAGTTSQINSVFIDALGGTDPGKAMYVRHGLPDSDVDNKSGAGDWAIALGQITSPGGKVCVTWPLMGSGQITGDYTYSCTFGFFSPTTTDVPYTQDSDAATGRYNNCATFNGTLNWVGVGYAPHDANE